MITVPEHAKTKRMARERKTEMVREKEMEVAVETAAAEEETDKYLIQKEKHAVVIACTKAGRQWLERSRCLPVLYEIFCKLYNYNGEMY